MTRGWRASLALATVAALAAAPSLGNGFAYDDAIIVESNPSVQTLMAPWAYLGEGYWPSGGDLLYRPATIWLYAVQWRLGGGSPLVFHAVNVCLLAAAVILLHRLARRLMPEPGAALAAAVFALHPVHVEAVANVVGQAELNVGMTALAAVLIYLTGRRLPHFSLGRRVALALLLVWGALAKEQGLMLPFLLLVAEITVVDGGPIGRRARTVGSVLLLQVPAVLAVLVLRMGAVGFSGGMEAVAIRDATVAGRSLTMLGVVPEWARLLLFPWRLQADYSPNEIVPAAGVGAAQLLGAALLIAWAAGVLRWWRRRPELAFGLLWMAFALAPVSNVLLPTGVVLAERTLYLPSVGVALVLGGAAAGLWSRLAARPGLRVAAVGGAALVLAAAGWRTATRQLVWRDTGTLLAATVRDAPESYRARWQYAKHLAGAGDTARATALYREAAALYQEPNFLEEYGQHLRVAEGCGEAIPHFRRAIGLDRMAVIARSRLYYCLLQTGYSGEAREVAATGAVLGDSAFVPLVAKADSALAASHQP